MEEEKKITIEIRQEVAVMLSFVVAGVILVTGSFLIPGNSTELWPALISGAIAAAVYLITMFIYVTRKPIRPRTRALTILIALLAMGSSVLSVIWLKDQTDWQARNYLAGRARMGQSVVEAEASDCLLKTLQQFYEQKGLKKKTLSQVFQNQYTGVVQGSNIHTAHYDEDSLRIYVGTLDPDRLVLIALDPVVKGRNAQFENYGGRHGLAQYRFTLTPKGIDYGSDN